MIQGVARARRVRAGESDMEIQQIFQGIGLVACGIAAGAAWVCAIASPNCSFDKLTGARADSHVRELLYRTLLPIAAMLLAGAIFFLLAASWVAAGAAGMSAFGFLATRLLLAPRKGRNPRGVVTRRKDQRASAVLLSLMFMLSSGAAIVLGLIGL